MSQSILERVGKAMADAVAMNYDHNEVIFTLYAKAAIEAMKEIPPEIIKLADSYSDDGRGSKEAWQNIIELILNEK